MQTPPAYPLPPRGQLDGVQALRFIAAFLVVVGHSTYYASERLGAGSGYWHGGGSGVDIFFAISGFVMILSSRRLVGRPTGWREFAAQRLTRIGPLYWLATTVKLFLLIVAGSFVLHAKLDLWGIVKSYFFIPTRNADGVIIPLLGVGWTLVFEIFFYAVFAACLAARVNLYLGVGSVLAVCAAASTVRPIGFSPLWFYCDPIVLEFLLGMLVAAAYVRGRTLAKAAAVGMGFAAFIVLLLPLEERFHLPRILMAGIPAALLLWAAVSLESVLHRRIPAVVLFFGAASYSLYLFHPMCAPVAPELLRHFHAPSRLASVGLSILIALVAGAVVYRWIELPLTRVIRTLPGVRERTHPSVTRTDDGQQPAPTTAA